MAAVPSPGPVVASPTFPNLHQPPQRPTFLPHARPAPPAGRSLGAREVRAPGRPGPRRVVERRGAVRRAARAERGAGRILPPRVRRVRGQARLRRGVRRGAPPPGAPPPGGDGGPVWPRGGNPFRGGGAPPGPRGGPPPPPPP